MSNLFKAAKATGETILEHGVHTYHIGAFLYDNLSGHPYFPVQLSDRGRFLYACLFHDVGKMLISHLGQHHTPLTQQALANLQQDPQYHKLLALFELDDLASDNPTLSILEEHHDTASQIGLWVAIADHIASSEANPDWNTTALAVASFVGLSSIKFFHISLPSFSKNEFNAIGKLILLKLLYETVEQLPQLVFLHETKTGCRIATSLSREQTHALLAQSLNQTIKDFVRQQDMGVFFKGGSQEAEKYAAMLPFNRDEILEIVASIKKREIEFGLRRKLKNASSPPTMAVAGLPDNIFETLAQMDFSQYGLGKQSLKPLKRGIGSILKQVGVSSYAHNDVVDPVLANYIFTLNKVRTVSKPLQFDISLFLAIDNFFEVATVLPREEGQNLCIDCGAYHGVVEASTVLIEMMQHSRETIFRERMTDARRHLYLCPMCYIETLLNVLLCGTTGGKQTRVKPITHMVLTGLDIPDDVLREQNPLFPERILRELKGQRITQKTLYARDRDINIALLSLSDSYLGPSEKYQELLFSCQAASIKAAYPLITSFSVNVLPHIYDNSVVQLHNKDAPLPSESLVDWFFYVFAHSGLGDREERRHYVVEYVNRPLLGIAYLFRRNYKTARYDDDLERMVRQLTQNDVLFQILDDIWEMAKLGDGLETGRNVGSFLTTFKGRPQDIDRIANKMLKSENLPKEQRQSILDIWQKVRQEMQALNEEQRRELVDRSQKTKYLMNSKKFYEIQRFRRR